MNRTLLLLLLSFGTGVGCGGSSSTTTTTSIAKATPSDPNALCEHHVPAALCTKCHPELAAVFKSQGDWCQEHGVPESQCLQCNPKLTFGEKKEQGPAWCNEHGVPEEKCTKCHPALVAKFIEAGDYCREHGFPESVCPVHHPEVAKGLGHAPAEFPEPGTQVRLTGDGTAEAAGLKTTTVEERPFAPSIEVVGQLEFNANRVAELSPKDAALIMEVRVDVGDDVRAGQGVVVVTSASAGKDRAGLQAADAALASAQFALTRKLQLTGVVAQREVDEARRDLATAQAERNAAEAALKAQGASTEAVDGGSRLVLSSPLAGTVVDRDAVVGRNVEAGHVLLKVADVSLLWAQLDVPEEQAAAVLPGQRVTLLLDGGREPIEGKIARVGASVDPRTRTVRARVEVANPDRKLKAGAFLRARIETASQKGALLIPREAVQTAEGNDLVFADRGGGVFDPIKVTVGRVDGDDVEVIAGLAVGTRIVTAGAFLLKTEVLKDSIGAGCTDD
jgi:cobalt-zinc-cadmium efflux system membrane fusion protein